MTLGQRLKEARLAAGITQEDLARQLGVSRQTISSWENERSAPDIGSAVRLGKLYNTSLDTLLTGEEVIRHFEDLAARKRKFWEALFETSIILWLLGTLLSGQGFAFLGSCITLLGAAASLSALAVNLLVFSHSKGERLCGWLGLVLLCLLDLCQILGLGSQSVWVSFAYSLAYIGVSLLLFCARVWWYEWYSWKSPRLWLIVPLLILVPFLNIGRSILDTGLNTKGNPFFQKYKVEAVLYPQDDLTWQDVCVEFPDEKRLKIAWDGVNLENIGAFTYSPPSEGDPSQGIWVLTAEEDPTLTYRMVLDENGELTLSHYDAGQLQWKWKLEEYPYHASMVARTELHTSSISLSNSWYPAGYPSLEPFYSARPTVAGSTQITLQLQNPETEALTLYEDYYHAGQLETRTYTLSPRQEGIYEWEISPRYESRCDQCVIYRFPYDGGEFRVLLTVGP